MNKRTDFKDGECQFNHHIDCRSGKCYACGWNPAVAERRIEAWKEKKADHAD